MHLRTSILAAIALTVGFSQIAEANRFRATKAQTKQIAVVKRKIQRSKLQPHAKAKAIKAIEKAQAKLKTSDYKHLRLHTSSNRYESTLVFNTGQGKSMTLYFRPKAGGDVKMFQEFGNTSRQVFRARALSADLTVSYRGRVDYKTYQTTSAYRLNGKSQSSSSFLTQRLFNNLYNAPVYKASQLVPELRLAMSQKARGLDFKRGKVRVDNSAPRQVREANGRGE